MIRQPLFAVALSLIVATPAFAHARPTRTDPRAGALLHKAPSRVSIWFDDSLQPGLSMVMVQDDGHAVNVGMGKVDAHDKKLLVVPLARAGVGKYVVDWHAMSDDGHPTSGKFGFTVGR